MNCFQVIPVTYSTSDKVTILASNYSKRYNLDWLTISNQYFNNVPHELRYSSKKATTLAVERTNSNKYKSRVYCQLTKEANF